MGDLSYTEERARDISFSELPEGSENFYIYTTVDQETIDPYELKTLNGQRIGVTSNSYQQGLLMDWLEENGYHCTVVEYNGSSATAAALENGEVDVMIMTDMASMGGYVPVVNIGHAEFFFGVNKNRPDILEELNNALCEIQTTDPYYNEATYSRYITSSLSNSYLSKKERKWLNEHDFTVRLGYLSGNLPYCDETEGNEVKGLLAVIAETFRESFGIQVETICYSGIDEMITAIFNGEIDLFGPLNESFEAVRDHELLEYHGTATCGADLLIQNASKIICRIYANSPVFRIGGDEFIIVLTGADYGRRDERLSELRGKNQTITEVQQIKKGLVSLASGMAVYDKEMDHTVADVFTRADEAMYACKKQMKQKNE